MIRMISKYAKVIISSPNRYSTRYEVSRISIHCMAGDLTVEQCGNIFANPKRKASSNYGIGTVGDCACYVNEKYGSWCTSDKDNDLRAITIEVANDGDEKTGWHVSDRAFEMLIKLLVDICTRHGKKRLVWIPEKTKALAYKPKDDELLLTVHRWFAAKACPGDYLFNKHPEIVKRVNEELNGYKIKATAEIRVRLKPSKESEIVTVIHKGEVYTIIDEKKSGGYNWGKLKSGVGLISLRNTKRI